MYLFLGISTIAVTIQGCMPLLTVQLPPPVIHYDCVQRGCQAGFVCGKYGCARERKAFGVKSLKETAASNDDSLTPVKMTSVKGNNVAAMMFQCCEDNLLPDDCLEKCSFTSYSKQTILSMFLRQSTCPLQVLPVLHYCASRSHDHRPCCSRRGVPESCLIFCGPPFDYSTVNHQQLMCMEHLDRMKACFYEDFRKEMSIRRRKVNVGKSVFF